MAYAGMKLEDAMLIEYGLSGNILESSTPSPSSSADGPNPISSGSDTWQPLAKRRSQTKKKKKITTGQVRTVKTAALTDDGFGWRKYGQKYIHNKPHPKSYYRCTHSTDEKCQAKKWVQQESDNPPIYKTTYIDQHTCKSPLKTPHIFYPDSSFSSSHSCDFMMQSFDNSYYSSMSHHPTILRFDSPNSVNNVYDIHMEHTDEQMEATTTPQSKRSVDPMMLQEGLEINDSFPWISSPNCDLDSYDFDIIPEDILGLDLGNYMQECYY